MTEREIIKKAIKKAKGYKISPVTFTRIIRDPKQYSDLLAEVLTDRKFWKALCESCKEPIKAGNWESDIKVNMWATHMTQCLVYSEDRIQYLKQFI